MHLKIPKTALVACFSALMALLSGCGENQALRGRVVFPDGTPLKAGTIMFSSATTLSRSPIDRNGYFDVGSLKASDGIPPGTYKVFISGAFESVPDEKDPSREITLPLIDPRFASQETTPLEITIPGEKVFNITVEKPTLPPKK